jgi:hypothetical protein
VQNSEVEPQNPYIVRVRNRLEKIFLKKLMRSSEQNEVVPALLTNLEQQTFKRQFCFPEAPYGPHSAFASPRQIAFMIITVETASLPAS